MSGHAAGFPAHVTDPDPPAGAAQLSGSGLPCGRSHSEPPRPCLPSRPSLTRRYSEVDNVHLNEMTAMPSRRSILARIDEDGGEPEIAPSPAPTEVDEPESQGLIDQLQAKGIKVRDFAYAPPYITPHPCSNPSPIASTSAAHVTLTRIPAPKRTTEVFDPYKGLTEVDYRWTRTDRSFPVTGKTLRRLLDMGWLTVDELSTRGHAVDVAALQAFDQQRAAAKEANGGLEAFPWRLLIPEGTQPPTMEERRLMLENRGGLWKQLDRMMASNAATAEWRRQEEEAAEQKKKELEELERERERKRRGKRKMEDGADIDFRKEELEDLANSSCGSKRVRLSPSDDGEGVLSSQDANTGRPLPPRKQYPAPLHAYNPKLYPDAANIIQASSQSQSQSQPRSSGPPPMVERGDTPPAIDRTDPPPLLDGGGNTTTSNAQRLVHPKKQGRGLGRTQTFTEFF